MIMIVIIVKIILTYQISGTLSTLYNTDYAGNLEYLYE